MWDKNKQKMSLQELLYLLQMVINAIGLIYVVGLIYLHRRDIRKISNEDILIAIIFLLI